MLTEPLGVYQCLPATVLFVTLNSGCFARIVQSMYMQTLRGYPRFLSSLEKSLPGGVSRGSYPVQRAKAWQGRQVLQSK